MTAPSLNPSGAGGIGSKLRDHPLRRQAIVYVRQSPPQHVVENVEATARQQALVERAIAWGWSPARGIVIDEEQGQSGPRIATRLGFPRWLAEVSVDHVGLMLGLELSRLARSHKDWHQLLELCAIFGTLLAEADGLYDPMADHDRLVWGLRGMMNAAALSMLKGRMHEGRRTKAKRGALLHHPPLGQGRGTDGDEHRDPDAPAQRVVRLIFEAFEHQGSLHGVLRDLVAHEIRVPMRPHQGGNRGQLEWHRPHRMTWQNVLPHPIYAGAYRWGQRKIDPRQPPPGRPNTGNTVNLPESCAVCIKDRLPASISWQRFEAMPQRLANNRRLAHAPGAPREGPSLLGGLLQGGRCGRRLAPSASGKAKHLRYTCGRATMADGASGCLSLSGAFLDDGVVAQRMAVLQPASLALSLAAAHALRAARSHREPHGQQR